MLVDQDLGDVFIVGNKLVVDVFGVDTELVAEVAGCCQCPHHHAQLCPFSFLVREDYNRVCR